MKANKILDEVRQRLRLAHLNESDIKRVWTLAVHSVVGEVTHYEFHTRNDLRDAKNALKKAKGNYTFKDSKVDMDGEFIV